MFWNVVFKLSEGQTFCFLFTLKRSPWCWKSREGWRLMSHLCNRVRHTHICWVTQYPSVPHTQRFCVTRMCQVVTSHARSHGEWWVRLLFMQALQKRDPVSCLACERSEEHPAASQLISSPCVSSFRTFTMTTQRWSSTWTLQTAWWWRATCSRGPAMPSRPGTGKKDGGDVIGRRNRRCEVNRASVFQLSSGCYSWSDRVHFLWNKVHVRIPSSLQAERSSPLLQLESVQQPPCCLPSCESLLTLCFYVFLLCGFTAARWPCSITTSIYDIINIFIASSLQTVVLHPEQSACLSEEAQGESIYLWAISLHQSLWEVECTYVIVICWNLSPLCSWVWRSADIWVVYSQFSVWQQHMVIRKLKSGEKAAACWPVCLLISRGMRRCLC